MRTPPPPPRLISSHLKLTSKHSILNLKREQRCFGFFFAYDQILTNNKKKKKEQNNVRWTEPQIFSLGAMITIISKTSCLCSRPSGLRRNSRLSGVGTAARPLRPLHIRLHADLGPPCSGCSPAGLRSL